MNGKGSWESFSELLEQLQIVTIPGAGNLKLVYPRCIRIHILYISMETIQLINVFKSDEQHNIVPNHFLLLRYDDG